MKKFKINYPIFIPAITSVKNMHNYEGLIKIILNGINKAFMLSALDLKFNFINLNEILKDFNNRKNKIFFLDSGGFEKYHLSYFKKKWLVEDLISVIIKYKPDIIVAYDEILPNNELNDPIPNFLETIKLIENEIPKEKNFEIVIHASDINQIFLTINNLREYEKFLFAICIPERNLGNSIRTRFMKIEQICNYIKNKIEWKEIKIHLMGCSDFLHMIKYAKLGIDIFDGVHWQDLIINPATKMFQDYSSLLTVDCRCPYCLEFKQKINENYGYEEIMYNYYALNHNLFYYNSFMED